MNAVAAASVALVSVDLDVPHLDHPFEYSIPEQLSGQVAVGSRVQVAFSGRMRSGWVTGLAAQPQSGRKLQPIKRVVGPFPLVTAGLIRTAQYLAARYATNLKQILAFAVPTRRAHVEKAFEGAVPETAAPSPAAPQRAVSSLYPGQMMTAIEVAVRERPPGETVVVVLPTSAQVARVSAHLRTALPDLRLANASAEEPDAARYRVHLQAMCGQLDVIVGTRSAVWTPMPAGGRIVIWDDGDDRLREQRSPRMDALDVAVARSHIEHLGLLALGYARSVKDQALIDSHWAKDTSPDRTQNAALIPRTQVFDWADAEREGPTGRTRLPDAAIRLIRRSLENGPVLVQVAAAGYETELACPLCGMLPADATPLADEGTCPHPAHARGRRIRVGSDRIRDELERAFREVPVFVSSSTAGVRDTVPSSPSITVATTSAEPVAEDGYSAVIVAEAEAIAYLDSLDAQMEAERRFMGAIALGRPGGPAMIVGSLPPVLEQAIVRWQPALLAQQELRTRAELGFPPTRWVASVTGSAQATEQVTAAVRALAAQSSASQSQAGRKETADGVTAGDRGPSPALSLPPVALLGIYDAETSDENGRREKTAVFSCAPALTNRMMSALRDVQVARSAAGESLLRIECNPSRLVPAQPG